MLLKILLINLSLFVEFKQLFGMDIFTKPSKDPIITFLQSRENLDKQKITAIMASMTDKKYMPYIYKPRPAGFKSVVGKSAKEIINYFEERQSRKTHFSEFIKLQKDNLIIDEIADEQKGWTLLHYAASIGKLKACKILVAKGFDMATTDKTDLVPMNIALANDHDNTANWFHKKELKKNKKNNNSKETQEDVRQICCVTRRLT